MAGSMADTEPTEQVGLGRGDGTEQPNFDKLDAKLKKYLRILLAPIE